MRINDIATTNKLLLIIVIPLLFYILDELAFIFIPFMFAVFLALLFTPLMRWLKRKNTPHAISLIIVIVAISGFIFGSFKLIQLSGKQIDEGKTEIISKFDDKVTILIKPLQEFLGIQKEEDERTLRKFIQSDQLQTFVIDHFGNTFSFVQATLSKFLMTIFFLILLLAGSFNLQLFLNETLRKGKMSSVKTFLSIESSITKFLKVKFLISLGTGIGFGLICYFFDVSFPLFWGLFAFVINFVQMVGSIIATVLLAIFAFIEIEAPGVLLAIVLLATGVQVLFGSILEPIMMGKSFKINIIMVLVALMFWGYLWGVPGLILAIPMTVLLKTILSQYESTKGIARLMS